MRPLLLLSCALAAAPAAAPAAAERTLYSRAAATAYQSGELCEADDEGDYECAFSGDVSAPGEEEERFDASSADASASLGVPADVDGQASARAAVWENHAAVHAAATTGAVGGPDPTAGQTTYWSTLATAEADSRWTDEITFGGSAGGTATFDVAVEGSGLLDGLGASGQLVYQLSFYDPALAPGPKGPIPQARLVVEVDPSAVAAPGCLAVTPAFTTCEFGPGALDEVAQVSLAFEAGKTYAAAGSLLLSAQAQAQWPIDCPIGASGPDCSVGDPSSAGVDLAFGESVRVTRLDVPPGTTALGFGGAALPFPVPEPERALLVAVGAAVLLVAGRAPRRRGRARRTRGGAAARARREPSAWKGRAASSRRAPGAARAPDAARAPR